MKRLVYSVLCIMMLFSGSLYAQNVNVKGKVIDAADGTPLPGVTVQVIGTSNGVATDVDGTYSLQAKIGDVLKFSYIGYITQEVKFRGGALNIKLASDAQQMDAAVVVGFGTQKKENLTGAVSAVSAKELLARPVNTVVEALQGVVPGMNISTGSYGGALNSKQRYNIRGTGTIGAGSSVSPLVLIDGMEGDMTTLNPNDIENISVLKDAASSSIYGSRAPGGVILITTKKGKAGRTVVNYNNSFRFLSPLNMPRVADSYRFALAMNDLVTNNGQAPMYSETKLQQILDYQNGKSTKFMWDNGGRWNGFDDDQRKDIMPTGNTDWLRAHFGNSFTQEHSISVNGGNEKTQYYLSANYLDQGGLLTYGNDKKKRYSITSKINTKLNDWIKLGYTVRFNRNDYNAPSFTGGNIHWNVFYFDVVRYWPVIPLKDPNGFYTEPSKIGQIQNGGREINQDDVITQQLAFVFEPIENLKINAELNYKIESNFIHKDYQTVYGHAVDKSPYAIANQTSSVTETGYRSNFFNPNIYAQYTTELGDGHNLKGLLGFQSEVFKNRSVNASQNNIAAGVPTLNTTSEDAKAWGGYGNWSTMGVFGRLNYDYKGRYLLEANLRYDGTSRFLEDKRWNIFPSFSFGWNIAKEEFFKDYTDLIGTLKLRASWGELGNQNTDNWYPFYTSMWRQNTAGGWLLGGKKTNISREGGLTSALLTWERTQTLNFGLDVAMLEGRLNASLEVFQRKSIDMVGPAPELPNILGTGVPKVNNLDMTSRGWELQISWNDRIGEFGYGAVLTMSDNTVTIDKYPNESKTLGRHYPGSILGDIWGYESIGIAKTQEEMDKHLASLKNGGQDALGSNWGAGDVMYKDLNGDGKIDGGKNTLEDSGDRKVIGNSNPHYNFGLNLNADYRGFDLKVFFQGTLKRDYMPGGGTALFWGAVGYWQANFFEPHLDYFRPENTANTLGANVEGYYPRPLSDGRNKHSQTRYLQNAAYARLKNVTLGYTLPSSITDKLSISNLRVFISGENLLTITNLLMYDPETVGIGRWDGATYPLSKSFSCGLSITF